MMRISRFRCLSLASIAALPLTACSDLRHGLPDKIEVEAVIASDSSGFFMEGCASAVYRLAPSTAAALLRQGPAFFRGIEPPRNQNPRNPYSKWMETPLPDPGEGYIHARGAIGGCGGGGDFRSRELERALRAPGSHYALTANREGMMLVMPGSSLAAFLYFG